MITKDKWILDENGNPVPESDLMKWAEWIEVFGNRRVAYDQIGSNPENFISTVFLGLDYSFSFKESHKPLLFETMIFGCGDRDNDCYRYATRDEALAKHQELLEELKNLHLK